MELSLINLIQRVQKGQIRAAGFQPGNTQGHSGFAKFFFLQKLLIIFIRFRVFLVPGKIFK